MEVYKILSEIMEKRNLTVADVARMSNLPDSTVRGIVTRQQKTIALDVAFKLSDGLGVSLEQLNGIIPIDGFIPELYKAAEDMATNAYWEKIKSDPRKFQVAIWLADLDAETFKRVDQVLTAAFER